jgi:hypothetical protein
LKYGKKFCDVCGEKFQRYSYNNQKYCSGCFRKCHPELAKEKEKKRQERARATYARQLCDFCGEEHQQYTYNNERYCRGCFGKHHLELAREYMECDAARKRRKRRNKHGGKAAMIAHQASLTVIELMRKSVVFVESFRRGMCSRDEKRQVVVVGQVVPFTAETLGGPPLYGFNEDTPLIKFEGALKDSTGVLANVTFWHAAFEMIFQLDGATCVGYWQDLDDEDEGGCDELLERLNSHPHHRGPANNQRR